MKPIFNDGEKRNYVTGHAYTGRNAAILENFDDTFFMTFLQGKELGLHLRKGSSGIALLLVDKRKAEHDGEEKNYFYKKSFMVFGLSCWERNGFSIPEPMPDAPFPWCRKEAAAKTEEKKEGEVFKEKAEPVDRVKKTPAPVKDKSIRRADFLKSAAAFFPAEAGALAYFSITGGKAVFMTRVSYSHWQLAVVENVTAPDFTTVVESKTVKTIIKGIDTFKDGLIGNKRVCWKNEAGAADIFDPESFNTLFFSHTVPCSVSIPAEIARSVSYAASTDFVKPSFNSVCIAPGAVVASDSRRLAVYEYDTGINEDFIIPLNLAKNAVSYVAVNGNIARSGCEHGFFATRLIDGQFPNWKNVIPSIEGAHVLDAPRSLWSELKGIAHKPSFKSVLRPEGCFIMDQDETGKSFERKVSEHSYPEAFGVNAAYMLDAVREDSVIYVAGPFKPILIKTGSITDVVMPIQIKPAETEE